MGVTGLWAVVQPCARPIKLETLNKKRLAVDASIWIYQFLKAVRDKEGNALRNSHVVGFFRRICKLLFFGIKPVFVFDGGAPALKRQTVSGRKARREGRREDAVRTAGKLLAVQMQRRAEEEDKKRREERARPTIDQEEEELPENLVYVEELQMTEKERQQNRQFRKKDAYHLPDLDVSLAEMGAPNDPRIMSHEELEEYARQFHTGEDVNIYDFSKIDFNSSFFLSLPASDRYNILNAARLRSRLRMGYSKEQLDTMFPDRMAFSKFQVERVKERNELTQRLMTINGMNGEDAMFGVNGQGRVAGEKGREYVLVKNDGVEGGWALGVVSNKGEGERNKPIDVDRIVREVKVQDDEDADWEDDGFEDVPIEGLNRLPKRAAQALSPRFNDGYTSSEAVEKRRAIYDARQKAAGFRKKAPPKAIDDDPDSLFLAQEPEDESKTLPGEDVDTLFEDVSAPVPRTEEEEDLERAIALSLQDPDPEESPLGNKSDSTAPAYAGPRIDQPLEFNQKNAKAGRMIAQMTNARATGAARSLFLDEYQAGDNMDLEAALAESRKTKYQPQGRPQGLGSKGPEIQETAQTQATPAKSLGAASTTESQASLKSNGFDGPLPFESLNLGRSMLSKKKKKPVEEQAGGFEKELEPEKQAQPLPPWFSGDIREETAAQLAVEDRRFEGSDLDSRERLLEERRVLRRQETGEVIGLDGPKTQADEVVEIVSSSDEGDDVEMLDALPIDSEIRMDDVADMIRAEPPKSDQPKDNTGLAVNEPEVVEIGQNTAAQEGTEDEELLEWEDSDHEDAVEPAGGVFHPEVSKSPSPDFENVGIPESSMQPDPYATMTRPDEHDLPAFPTLDSFDQPLDEELPMDQEDLYSDPEDDDLMRQLAVEAEEHARFASTLNSKSQLQNAEDYERELRQLRNQQKKDRRDADEVSHIMITECQQLLKLFGLPYVTAPMEAEAQCAELVSLGLVDGIVTDDSDIFLFGGTRVYKNMFNQAKFVECYLSSDLEKEYSLDRQKLIRIAHLLGSDYTEGLPSVGPVTALEILSEFETLEDFKEWWTKVQTGRNLTAQEDALSPFRRKFKRNATKLFLPPTFPDKRVDHAYLHPEVDSDPSPFAWGVPDLEALRQFLMATIGWSQERTDEVLVPVIKDMNRRENEGTQANITQFFGGGVGAGSKAGDTVGNAFAPRRRKEGKSRRMETALGKLHERARRTTIGEDEDTRIPDGDGDRTVVAEPSEGVAGTGEFAARTDKPKSRKRPTGRKASATVSSDASVSDSATDDEYAAPKKARKRTKGASSGRRTVKSTG
ncbi:MAG: PIN domain [Lasallia pustulata]|uniref:PIN domain n=1 Tax=Lasallia pustulata TaxID=136370 RepID=A0A5M8PMG9_9LECA|nr:MAG: PIN domain [Lasallia pustulata]